MKNIIKYFWVFESILVLWLLYNSIIPHWDKTPLVSDWFSFIIFGEIIFDLYNQFKNKYQ